MAENSLAILTKASQMLAEANTIQKAKELKDLALTAADWARRKGMGQEAIQHCKSYSTRAEIRMGEMLAATERAKRGPDKETSQRSQRVTADTTRTLAELHITKRDSVEAQMLAGLTETLQEAVIEGRKSKTQVRRELKAEEIKKKVSLPDAKYRVLYADPSWTAFEGRSSALRSVGPAPACPERCREPTQTRQTSGNSGIQDPSPGSGQACDIRSFDFAQDNHATYDIRIYMRRLSRMRILIRPCYLNFNR